MPRQGRIQSGTGVYHVMMRGINHQRIFEDSEDHYTFLQCLRSAQEQYTPCGDRLPSTCHYYAYALMSNHFHLLLHAKDDTVGNIVKRIASSYVYYFNRKYGRDGHLFKERFRSEPCEDWTYFVTLLRYIHQNPFKTGVVSRVSEYEFTSWHEYLGREGFFPLCNVNVVLGRFRIDELTVLIDAPLNNDVSRIEYEEERERSMSDDCVMLCLKDEFGITDGQQVQELSKDDRDLILAALLKRHAGVRKLQRLTGIGKKHIFKCFKRILALADRTATCPLCP